MKTKKDDVKYCGVRKDVILNANPELDWENVHHFKTFLIDRYKIHLRKDVKKLPAPWTDNSILQEFKFTNVRREHDRQSKYLIENITNNDSLTLEDKIVNSFLFRAWNNWLTLRDFGFPYSADRIYSPKLKSRIRSKFGILNEKDPNRLWYNNAYNQGGTKSAWKFENADLKDDKQIDPTEIPLRPLNVGIWLGRGNVVEKLLNAKDQKECFEIIKTVRGFADFLAYQVFVDLTYIEDFPFSENEFVIAGPGCKKGLDYLFKNRDGMTYEECIFWLRNMINSEEYCLFTSDKLYFREELKGYSHKSYEPLKLFSDLPRFDRCVNVMSLENCMCELSKYIRAVNGTGRPKNRYKPHMEE